MSSEKLSSEKTIEIVNRHKESVKGYVRRHELDIYQINKLIKAETALRDRNSVLNFLRKEKEKIKRKTARENALKEDVTENQVVEKGGDRISDLKNDIIDIRQQMTDISAAPVENEDSSGKKDQVENVNHDESTTDDLDNISQNSGTEESANLPVGAKSRRKLYEEVENHFDSLPNSESGDLNSIVSSFRNLLPGGQPDNISELTSDLEPVDIFKEFEDETVREKAIKTAYTVKKCLESSQDRQLSYSEIADQIEDMGLENSRVTAEFFRFMEDYDFISQPEFEELDSVINDCRAVVESFS